MSDSVLKEERVDPFYSRFWTASRDEAVLESIVAPSIERFAAAGFRTAIVLEKAEQNYLIHCFAVRQEGQQAPQAVSQQVATGTQDKIQTQRLSEAQIEPNQVSFF